MIKVLVVDDEPSILEPLKRVFESSGYETLSAKNGKDCLDIFKRELPQVVFLDIILPDIDGIEMLKKIKEIKNDTIVTMVSTKKDENTMAACFKYGATDYITKPFYSETLKDIVNKNVHLADTPKYQAMEKPDILICDDEDDSIIAISRSIQRRYFANILFASSGDEAINLCRDRHFDLIFMDVRMPGVNGVDAVSQIKKISADTSIIVISGYTDPEIVTAAIKAGAEDFIGKPFNFEAFNDKIETVLKAKNKFAPKNPF